MITQALDNRLARVEKILLGMEWAGVEVEESSTMGGECVTLETRYFCLLCSGYKPGSMMQLGGDPREGHRPGCLFLELPR